MVLETVTLGFNDRLRIRGISDTHIGSRAAEENRLKRDIQKIAEEDDSYVILLGDQMESITLKDVRFQAGSVKEELLYELDSLLNAQIRDSVKIFEPIKHKILGALCGNHELKVMETGGIDTHRIFCETLGIKDLGYSCMLRMTLGKHHQSGKKRNVVIYAHHGHGGSGRKTGASINRMEDLSAEWDFDIAMMGHNHKRHTSTRTKLSVTSKGHPRLIEKDQIFVRTGGYYKTFQESKRPSYSEKAGYSPTKIGSPPYIDITINGEHSDIGMRVTE